VRQISQNYKTGELAIVDVAAPARRARRDMVETRVSLILRGTERSIVDLARKSLLAKARERPDLVKKVLEKARREGPLAAWMRCARRLDLPIPSDTRWPAACLRPGRMRSASPRAIGGAAPGLATPTTPS